MVEKCEQSVGQQPGLPPGVRFDLLVSCQRVAKGEEESARRAVHEATREACEKLIEENVPPGPARQEATCALELDR